MGKSKNFSQTFRVALIVVPVTETKVEAWRRHVEEHPGDRNADIKIFNIASR